MKKIFSMTTTLLLLSACQSQGVYVDGILVKPEDCYGLGNPACVKAGYRTDTGTMSKEMTCKDAGLCK